MEKTLTRARGRAAIRTRQRWRKYQSRPAERRLTEVQEDILNTHAPITAAPDPVDIYVGERIRLGRKSSRISQTALAEQIGVTFQQIQKYERGFNRVSASRLQSIAVVLGLPVAWFFDGVPQENTATDPDNALRAAMLDPDVRAIAMSAASITPELRKALRICSEAFVAAAPL